ncbi:uncharacterized protein LOC135392727 isoform X3 [Ornithodoros turicata]|uniref:uncharacterized protein LOC135392727 isoform X3 n=1 Tax=Ornithodoros turicata TaxID=34597 RepID=UPI0031390A84
MTRTVEPSRANVTEGGCLVARIPHNEKVHDAYFCLNSNDPMFQSRCCRCPQLTYRATLQRCVQRPACRGEHDPGHVHCGRVLSRHSILRGRKTASRCDLISGYNVACFSSM